MKALIALLLAASFGASAQTITINIDSGGTSDWLRDACGEICEELQKKKNEKYEREQLAERYAREALFQLQLEKMITPQWIAEGYSRGYTTLQLAQEGGQIKTAATAFQRRFPGVRYTCSRSTGQWTCYGV